MNGVRRPLGVGAEREARASERWQARRVEAVEFGGAVSFERSEEERVEEDGAGEEVGLHKPGLCNSDLAISMTPGWWRDSC